MARARDLGCSKCGGRPTIAPWSVESIVHRAGCPEGDRRQLQVLESQLIRAADDRDRLEVQLATARDRVKRLAIAADEAGMTRVKIADRADIARSRLYKILDGR